jgi:apolipoprotein N-acyltransferase
MPTRLRFCLFIALIAGLLGSLSQGIWSAWWLQILSLAVLFALLFAREGVKTTALEAFSIAFTYGLAYFVVGVGWLYISMHRYGGMAAPLAGAGVVLLSCLLASFSALAASLAVRLAGPQGHFSFGQAPIAAILLFSTTWGLLEWTRSWIFTGFPWIALGYSQIDGPLADAAPALGVYGLSVITAVFSGGLALFIVQARLRQWSYGALICMLMAWVCSFTFTHLDFTTATGKTLTVRLVQGNIPQEMKFDPVRMTSTMRYFVKQIGDSKTSLTVLPETAWTTLWNRTPPEIVSELNDAIQRSGTRVALGLPAVQDGQIFNSVAMIDARGNITSRYDKNHLVPFGEFVPPGFRWFVDQMHIPLGDFGRGALDQPLLRHENQSIAFNICYEDLFGEALADQVRRGAEVLINVSNIAWFGDSHALPQHLIIARMRALELGRPMLRATNTGVTASIGPNGKVLAQLANNQAGNLDIEVASTQGLTPYARFGNGLFLIGSCIFMIVGFWLARSSQSAGKLGKTQKTRKTGPKI